MAKSKPLQCAEKIAPLHPVERLFSIKWEDYLWHAWWSGAIKDVKKVPDIEKRVTILDKTCLVRWYNGRKNTLQSACQNLGKGFCISVKERNWTKLIALWRASSFRVEIWRGDIQPVVLTGYQIRSARTDAFSLCQQVVDGCITYLVTVSHPLAL